MGNVDIYWSQIMNIINLLSIAVKKLYTYRYRQSVFINIEGAHLDQNIRRYLEYLMS